jgi:hypothetical protein
MGEDKVSEMRALYLIFSHDNTEQLKRLVGTIRQLSPHSLIAIHHDPSNSSVDVSLFAGIPDVYLIPEPKRGEWGDFSLVEQYLHAMRWCEANLDFDWLISITGLSYPIKLLQEFEETLAKSEFDAYVYHFDAFDPAHWPAGTAETRYLFWYFKLPRFAYYYRVPAIVRDVLARLRVWLNVSQPLVRVIPMPRGAPTRLGIRRLRRPLGPTFQLCGGRQMLNVNRRTLRRIFQFLEDHTEWISYSRRVLIPDESFFTSIVANDSGIKVSNDILRYIKWPKQHAASGGVIETGDLDEVFQSSAPFGLKFDIRVSPDALDAVDARLGIDMVVNEKSHPVPPRSGSRQEENGVDG